MFTFYTKKQQIHVVYIDCNNSMRGFKNILVYTRVKCVYIRIQYVDIFLLKTSVNYVAIFENLHNS